MFCVWFKSWLRFVDSFNLNISDKFWGGLDRENLWFGVNFCFEFVSAFCWGVCSSWGGAFFGAYRGGIGKIFVISDMKFFFFSDRFVQGLIKVIFIIISIQRQRNMISRRRYILIEMWERASSPKMRKITNLPQHLLPSPCIRTQSLLVKNILNLNLKLSWSSRNLDLCMRYEIFLLLQLFILCDFGVFRESLVDDERVWIDRIDFYLRLLLINFCHCFGE